MYAGHCGCYIIENIDYIVFLKSEFCSSSQLIYRYIRLIPQRLDFGLWNARSKIVLTLGLEQSCISKMYLSEVTSESTGYSASSHHTG